MNACGFVNWQHKEQKGKLPKVEACAAEKQQQPKLKQQEEEGSRALDGQQSSSRDICMMARILSRQMMARPRGQDGFEGRKVL